MPELSKACCSIPPIISKGYNPKGKYETIAGFKTYVTGPADAKKAILMVFDIFGFFPQTLQGADILAYSDEHTKYRVYMPDWFEGEPMDISNYPPDTDEKKEKLGKFFATKAAPPKTVENVKKVMAELKGKADSWAGLGMCWGGKVISLSAQPGTPFKAVAECHPAMVDPKDAEGVSIPLCMLASKDEPVEDVKNFEKALKAPHYVETFSDQIHGWMGARSDLESPRVREEYERGYKTLLHFFHEHLASHALSRM
ncbi:MAG: hypothetical protein M1834_007421 [Cirrosporium novae-zelandiae]|nr:MAG: hypothetical protein M1834_007421 [Cirrosporium novae-zelandiae]